MRETLPSRKAHRVVPWRRAIAVLACLVALPASAADDPAPPSPTSIVRFSAAKANGTIPGPWAPIKINDRKTPTRYDLVDDDGTVVLHASADKSASMLGQPVMASLESTPWLRWRWKIDAPIASADNTAANREDSPARIILEFDGDRSRLPLSERTVNKFSEQLSGKPLPYATLMYIYANGQSVGTVIPNPHTKRIQMIVVSTGDASVGKWQSFTRNVREDYKRAFNEEAGKLLAIGVMTDTDNTADRAQAWYGDITLSAEK
jgi:hypothetical protein